MESIEKKTPDHIYRTLFTSMLVISAFTFGGGFVIITLMKKKFVEELHWLEEDEMLDLTAIAQAAPGAIAVNAAILLGYRIKGIKGVLVSTLATILPPLFIIGVISYFYAAFRENEIIARTLQVMRAGVAAVIFDVVVNLALGIFRSRKALYICLMFLALIASLIFSVGAIQIILICGIVGLLTVFFEKKSLKDKGDRA